MSIRIMTVAELTKQLQDLDIVVKGGIKEDLAKRLEKPIRFEEFEIADENDAENYEHQHSEERRKNQSR